jgi:hypothetical protein
MSRVNRFFASHSFFGGIFKIVIPDNMKPMIAERGAWSRWALLRPYRELSHGHSRSRLVACLDRRSSARLQQGPQVIS